MFVNHLAYVSNPSLHGDNPETFSGFRYVDKDPFAMVGRTSIAFGLGKHACPGRWFAVNNIKTAMSILIRKYEISSLDGKRPKNISAHGSIIIASVPLKFKNRK